MHDIGKQMIKQMGTAWHWKKQIICCSSEGAEHTLESDAPTPWSAQNFSHKLGQNANKWNCKKKPILQQPLPAPLVTPTQNTNSTM
jgi:hypothetical protein